MLALLIPGLGMGGGAVLVVGSDTQKPPSTFGDYSPTNADAEIDLSVYDVCDLSGFKAKRGQLVKQWNGLWVLPEYVERRNPQDLIRARGEKPPAQLSPEPDDDYLTTNEVTTDDL